MITLNVNSLENAEIFWQELGLEDEVALNEAVVHEAQTVSICVSYVDDILDKVTALGLKVSNPVALVDGRYLFSFIAPEGDTILVIGQWINEPYSSEKRQAYFEALRDFTVVNPDKKLSALTTGAIVLFGRVTCPWTRVFVQELTAFDLKNAYYVDTENTDLVAKLQAMRKEYDVVTVPTLIKIKDDGAFEKFDKKTQALSDFLNA